MTNLFNTILNTKDSRGIVHIIPLLVILVGIIGGVYLVRQEGFQIFRPQAAAESIQLQDGSCVTTKDGKKVLTCGNFSIKIYSPIDNQSSDNGIRFNLIKPALAAQYGTGEKNGVGVVCGKGDNSITILDGGYQKISECESGYYCSSRSVNLFGGTLAWCAQNGIPLVEGSQWRCQHANHDIGFGRTAGREAIHTDGFAILFANFGEQNIDCPKNYVCSKDEELQRTTCIPKEQEQQTQQPSTPQSKQDNPSNMQPVNKAKLSVQDNSGIELLWSGSNNTTRYRVFVESKDDIRKDALGQRQCPYKGQYFYCSEKYADGSEIKQKEGVYANVNGGGVSLPVSNFKDGATYSWWVDGLDNNGNKIGTSTAFEFTVNKQATTNPQAPKVTVDNKPITQTTVTTPKITTPTGTNTSEDNFKITLCGTEMTLGQVKNVVKSRGYNGLMDVVSVANEYLKLMCPGSQNNCSQEPGFPEIIAETPKVGSTEYIWVANCNRACLRNNSTGNQKDLSVDPNPNDPAACPKNYLDGNVNPATSNWCYGFKDGNRCMVLWSKKEYEAIKSRGGNPFDTGISPQSNTQTNVTTRKTIGYRIAETPLDNISDQQLPFLNFTNGMQIQYSLKDSKSGTKALFIQFKDNQGNIINGNPYPYTVQLIDSSSTTQTSCVAGQTECSCGNTLLGDTRNPGSCSPECGGGWCKGDAKSSKGGFCATCKP